MLGRGPEGPERPEWLKPPFIALVVRWRGYCFVRAHSDLSARPVARRNRLNRHTIVQG